MLFILIEYLIEHVIFDDLEIPQIGRETVFDLLVSI